MFSLSARLADEDEDEKEEEGEDEDGECELEADTWVSECACAQTAPRAETNYNSSSLPRAKVNHEVVPNPTEHA